MKERYPVMLLVSAPSGAGKTTLCRKLLDDIEDLEFSVSATTRAPREGEVNGRDYDFLSREEFLAGVEAGDFLEHAEVHGNLYGTRRARLEETLKSGRSVLLDVDVQGADQIRDRLSQDDALTRLTNAYVDVFIRAPSLEKLKERLETRGQDSSEVIAKRLHNAAGEVDCAERYAYQIINDDLDKAYEGLRSILLAAMHRTQHAY